jgi:catechol 2,3-dioxygenase-like lactoylglutathione lyase family enzyme
VISGQQARPHLRGCPQCLRSAMKPNTILRVARPTDHFEDVIRFYRDGLGMTLIGSFEDHDGVDGVMLGVPGEPYHLRGALWGQTSMS